MRVFFAFCLNISFRTSSGGGVVIMESVFDNIVVVEGGIFVLFKNKENYRFEGE